MKHFDISEMAGAYKEAIQFTDKPDDADEAADWSDAEFSAAFESRCYEDCALFSRYLKHHHPEFLETMSEGGERQVGHDFWLSRNGHGAGFFDGTEEEYQGVHSLTLKVIQKACREVFGDLHTFVNHDDTLAPHPAIDFE